jgi:hypothetical protein
MQIEHVIAFATEVEPDGLEIRVNFGIFAGRPATSAELDELARLLVPEVGDVSVVAEERHEVSDSTEAVLHQVRVDVLSLRDGVTPEKLVTLAEIWARACASERGAELSEL